MTTRVKEMLALLRQAEDSVVKRLTAHLIENEGDSYYATQLAQSCAESYVTRQRVSKVETSRNAPKKGRA